MNTNSNFLVKSWNKTTDYFLNNSWLRNQHNITYICEYLSNPQNYIYEMADWPDYKVSGRVWDVVKKPFQSTGTFLGSLIWKQEDEEAKKEREVTEYERYIELPDRSYPVSVQNLIVNISVEETVRRSLMRQIIRERAERK
jgi:hypothetical protein